jgi:RNA-directed DNA polymerase
VQEICTPGSEWGDGCKEPCRLGEATASKETARQGSAKATAPRPVPTRHNMSHEWVMKFIEHRVADHRILRLIQKWLKAGVSEDGQWSETKVGTPQGAVISPLLANVYLHYVFDLWVEVWRKKVGCGDVIVVRYADDLVAGFQNRTDAGRFLSEFRERLVRFGLELHPEKTRLIEFGRFAVRNRKQHGEGKPETFTFLGFPHFCGNLTSSGAFNVWRTTAKKRMVAKLEALKAELQSRKHHRTSEVGTWLRKVVQGYYQYHAVPGNTGQLRIFRRRVCRLWRNVLVRRSQRAQLGWDRLNPLLNRWIPHPRVLPTPTSASTPCILGKSRMRKRVRTDLCGGAISDDRPYRDSNVVREQRLSARPDLNS